MATCAKCGVENREGAKFCMSCGLPMPGMAMPPPPAPPAAPPPPPPPPPRPDPIGFISFAFLLLILGVTWAVNPGIVGDMRSFFEPLLTRGALLRPPETLIQSAVLFFALAGLGGLVTSGLRLALERRKSRGLSEGFSAVATLVFAYLLTFYASRALTASQVLAIEVAVVGFLFLVYIGLSIYWNLGAWGIRREAPSAPSRR